VLIIKSSPVSTSANGSARIAANDLHLKCNVPRHGGGEIPFVEIQNQA